MTDVAGIRWAFFLQPLILGAWFPRIPEVQAALGLSAGQLAFALVGMPIGLLTALAFGGRLAEALGTRRLFTVGLTVQAFLLPLPAFAFSGPVLFGALVIAGLSLAVAELSLNVGASEVEAATGRHIMNGCHGFWSVGVLSGSALGVGAAALGVAPGVTLVAVAAVMTLPLLLVARGIRDFAVHVPEAEAVGAVGSLSRPLAMVALFAFGIAMAEGAMADWAAVYLTEVFAAPAPVAGAGYTVFALFVAAGRFLGDPLKARMPVERLAQGFALVALAGLGLVVFAPGLGVGYGGIGLMGFGVALGFPLSVSAVSLLPGRSSAANVAILSQMSLGGFLIGPPVIGTIADASSMRGGLAMLALPLLLAFVLAPNLKRPV